MASKNAKGNFIQQSGGQNLTIAQAKKMLLRLGTAMDGIVKNVRPEFGAYMAYSKIQEEGSRTHRARPHIEPSVFANRNVILKHIADASLSIVTEIAKGATNSKVKRMYEQAWMQVLNGPVRQDAVNMAKSLEVFEFGHHMRSIRGYLGRGKSEILAEQAKARSGRTK